MAYKPTDEMLFRTITKGRKGTLMPAFESKLAPDDIWKIIEFLRDSNRQRKARESQASDIVSGPVGASLVMRSGNVAYSLPSRRSLLRRKGRSAFLSSGEGRG
jgi:hypothetical protein